MVANYTATKKRRKSDDYTPGGLNNRRPDRAVITYTNLIRRFYKNTRPIVLGGIEASLRRVAHYDYWSDSIRRSILFDAKADYLLFGMAEQSILDFAKTLKSGADMHTIRGICYIAKEPPEGESVILPSYEIVAADKSAFIQMFHDFLTTRPNNGQTVDPAARRSILVQNRSQLPPQNHMDSLPANLFSETSIH